MSRIDPGLARSVAASDHRSRRQARRDRDRPAGLAGRCLRRDRVLVRRGRQAAGRRPQGHSGADRDQPGRHSRHARRRRHPDHARRHDLARRGGRARHGQALRLRLRHHPRRLRPRHHEHRRAHLQDRRRHHHRRFAGPGAGRAHADDRAGNVRRIRHADGLGRFRPQARRSRQCRHARRCAHRHQVRRRGHRALPHRAHVLRGDPHPHRARDDPRRGRTGPPRRAVEAAADAARGFRRAVRDHEGPAGDDPAARSAAARIPAAHPGRDRGSRARDEHRSAAARRSRPRSRRVQSDARLPRLPARDRLSRDRRDAGARDLRGRGRSRKSAPARRSASR